jgi:DNA polymerase
MAKRLVIDKETRSTADLKKVGVARYAAHPDADVWCVRYAIDDQLVQIWVPGEPLPADLLAAIADPDCTIVAHNAGFERTIWRHILTPRYGWPNLPPLARWSCTMARALALALPPRLDKLADALSLTHRKTDDGIMHLMAKPRRSRGNEDPANGPYWFDDPEHLAQLYEYCRGDVECERDADRWLPELIPTEQALWCLDQTINDRGVYTDGVLTDKAPAIAAATERAVQDELRQITAGEIESTNCVAQTLAWLALHGCEVADLQKETLRRALTRKVLDPVVRRVLELRQEAAHASVSKFQALHRWRALDGRVRGAFRFHGAATGRWSGTGPQFQNFRRETEGTAAKLEAVMSGDIEVVRALGAPLEIVGDVARCAICAPPGSRLLVGDFSGIESCVIAWLAGETALVAMWIKFFRTRDLNDDPYRLLGLALGFPEDIARDRGKIAMLAFQYQGGLGAYKNFAPADDTATEVQIQGFKQAWRDQYPRIVSFWWGIDRAAVAAVQRAPQPIDHGRLTLQCEQLGESKFLRITLPSGRQLSYPFVKLITNRFARWAVEFMDNSAVNGGWVPCNHGAGCYGGLWTENIVSGIARDLLAAAMVRLEAAGYPVVLHVHDEIVCELLVGEGSLEEFKYLIERLPDWAAGMPVAAKVRNGPRFAEAETDIAIVHVPGSFATVAQAKPAKRKAPILSSTPATFDTAINEDIFANVLAWAIGRMRKGIRQ